MKKTKGKAQGTYKLVSEIDPCLLIDKFCENNHYQGTCELIDNAKDANATMIDINYDPLTNVFSVTDNGHGITPKRLAEALNYGYGDTAKGKMGVYNLGLKVFAPLMMNKQYATKVDVEIDTVSNGIRSVVRKTYDTLNPLVYLDNNIEETQEESLRNGTKVTAWPVFIAAKDIQLIKEKISARYYPVLANNSITIRFNGVKLKGVDMFYRDCDDSLISSGVITCFDGANNFDCKVSMYDVTKATTKLKYEGGNRTTVKESLNGLDKLEGKAVTDTYRGMYYKVNGEYVTMGGPNNSFKRHLGISFNTLATGLRIEVEIPDSHKRLVSFPFKTETNNGLKDYRTVDGDLVFQPVIDYVIAHNPFKKTKVRARVKKQDIGKKFMKNRKTYTNAIDRMFEIVNHPSFDAVVYGELCRYMAELKELNDKVNEVA